VTARRRATVVALAGVVAGILLPGASASADNVRDAQWHLGFLHVADAQRLANSGDGVTVAVVDTGVDATHPDLVGNVLSGTDFTGAGGDGHRDDNGHGTAMASLIAGHGHGDAGAMGIAPKAKILPVRAMVAAFSDARSAAEGIGWASERGARVMCMAFGAGSNELVERKAIEQAQAAGIVLVAAVGNKPKASTVGYPASYPGVVAVGGVDRQGNHADLSVSGPEVTLVAPAVDMISAAPNGKYQQGVGTSAATAIVAGVAALVRAKYPALSAAEVVHRLTATATDKGPPGRDDEYGYGIVDPVAALTADVPPLSPSSTPSAPEANGPTAAAEPSPPPNRTPIVLIGVGVLILTGAAVALVLRLRA
jgi:type VII secretion-associated serine protease mycosin